MKNQFVTYEIALALKELGFNEPCIGFGYKFEGELFLQMSTLLNTNSSWKKDENISLPLWQQAIDWLNNKYGVFITLALVANGYGFYIHKNYNTTNKGENYGYYPTLYEAREQAILKAIELIK